MRARTLTVGYVPVLAQRVTFVGELGWELYAPVEYTLTLWDTLVAAGTPFGLRPAGYRAIDAMRLEKGYRVWGSDISAETTPDEAGLAFAVREDKAFVGRAALLAAREAGGASDASDAFGAGDGKPDRRLRCLTLDEPRIVCQGSEPIRIDGRLCGRVTSGGYGFRVGESIAYAYLPSTVADGTLVQVGVFGTWRDATVRHEPLFDRTNSRVRA
jgi:4-methylaminobutanoate oxidase (formaldehyde-forming)